MTISSTVSRVDYVGTGTTGPFAFPFKTFAATDLSVTTRDAATGLETTLAYPADFTATGVGNAAGGSVTLTNALAVGTALTIRRIRPLTQMTSLRQGGAYFPETIEDAFDHLLMIDQQQQDALERSLRLPETVDPASIAATLPVPAAGHVLVWNDEGTALTSRLLSTDETLLPDVDALNTQLTATTQDVDALQTGQGPSPLEDADAWMRAGAALGIRPNRIVCATRVDATTLLAYRHLGGIAWMELQLTTGGVASGPYSWNQTMIRELLSFTVCNTAAWTYVGAWADLTSGDPALYVGHRVKQGSAAALTATITFTGAGDLYLVHPVEYRGGYLKAELDDDTNLCDALPSNGTYRYIDQYDPSVTLVGKRRTKIASNLAAGSHTLVLTTTTDTNPLNTSGAYRAYVNAIGLAGPSFGLPYQANTRAPAWAATTAYNVADAVTVDGRSYYCKVAGTTGGAAPTHTNGDATDGTVTWTFLTASSYQVGLHSLQKSGSQLEYAYQAGPDVAHLEDMGGILHGGETLGSATWYLDGAPVPDPAIDAWLVGETLALRQTISSSHSTAGAVANTVLLHQILNDRVAVAWEHVWQQALHLGFFYAHMWPLQHWSTAQFQYGVLQIATPRGGQHTPADFYGQANPVVGETSDYVMAAWGGTLMPQGAGGNPSATAATRSFLALLRVAPDAMNRFRTAGSYFAGMAMNTSGGTAPGFSSLTTKMYFERCDAGHDVQVALNEVWHGSADYYLWIAPGATIPFPPK